MPVVKILRPSVLACRRRHCLREKGKDASAETKGRAGPENRGLFSGT
jgi:hypothetical protein